MPVRLSAPLAPDDVRLVARLLQDGAVILYPTETFYAFGCLATRRGAVERVVRIKGRDVGKGLPLVASSAAQMAGHAELPPALDPLSRRFWPGPLTVVVGLAPSSAIAPLASVNGTVAFRVPGSDLARALADAAEGPLVATSANPAGASPVTTLERVDPALAAAADVAIDGPGCEGGHPSTILDLTRVPPQILREGAVSADLLREMLGAIAVR